MSNSDDVKSDRAAACDTRGDQDLVQLARTHGLGEEAARAVASIDAVMHNVRRNILRRDFGRQVLARVDPSLDVAHLDVIAAIGHNHAGTNAAHEEMTVGLVAERLGIDPSRASRLTAEVVERGYARRVASQSDARRICLELTRKGDRFVEAVRLNKWNLFARALGQWSEDDLITFARLFERFSSWATDNEGIARSAEEIKQMLSGTEPADAKAAKADLAAVK